MNDSCNCYVLSHVYICISVKQNIILYDVHSIAVSVNNNNSNTQNKKQQKQNNNNNKCYTLEYIKTHIRVYEEGSNTADDYCVVRYLLDWLALPLSFPDWKQSLLQHVGFLDQCFVPRTKFANSSAEKAWGKFHAACFKQIPGIAENLKLLSAVSYQVSRLLKSIPKA